MHYDIFTAIDPAQLHERNIFANAPAPSGRSLSMEVKLAYHGRRKPMNTPHARQSSALSEDIWTFDCETCITVKRHNNNSDPSKLSRQHFGMEDMC